MRKTGSLKDGLKKYMQGKTSIRVGILEDAKYPDGTQMAQVAAWNEYGSATAPARPFLRPCVNQNHDKWIEQIKKIFASTQDSEHTLKLVGEEMINDFKDSIKNTTSPANSPVTLLLKDRFPKHPENMTKLDVYKAINDVKAGITAKGGNNHPLIWSGDLLQHGFSAELNND